MCVAVSPKLWDTARMFPRVTAGAGIRTGPARHSRSSLATYCRVVISGPSASSIATAKASMASSAVIAPVMISSVARPTPSDILAAPNWLKLNVRPVSKNLLAWAILPLTTVLVEFALVRHIHPCGRTADMDLHGFARTSGVSMNFRNSAAPSMDLELAATTSPTPPSTKVKGLPSSAGNSHRSTLSKSPSMGVAPSGPQSNVHCQSPPVTMATSPAGKPSYLIGSHGLGESSSSTVSQPLLASVS